jgi:hypothetical protein
MVYIEQIVVEQIEAAVEQIEVAVEQIEVAVEHIEVVASRQVAVRIEVVVVQWVVVDKVHTFHLVVELLEQYPYFFA